MMFARSVALCATLILLASPIATAAAATLWRGSAAGQVVTLQAGDVTIAAPGARTPALSLRRQFFKEIGEPAEGDETHDISWRLLSVVGPLVSVETHAEGYVEGAAHPYSYGAITAYDAGRGGAVAKLTDYFAPDVIYRGLMGDGLVRQALKAKSGNASRPAAPRSLPQLIAAISGHQSDDCVWGFDDTLLSHFAFHHIAGDKVAVRFGLGHGCEVARGSLTILAVYLPIPAGLAPALAAAKAGHQGFLVAQAPKGVASISHKVKGVRQPASRR